MKAVTYLAFFALSATALVGQALASPPAGWGDDLDAAIAQAKAENKSVLVEFTGSDWCQPCIMMRAEVFSKPEFVAAATKKFVLVEIDLPNGDKEVAKKNQPIVEKYKIDGFPSVMLLDSAGKEFGRFHAAQFPKVDEFLRRLDTDLERKDLD